MANKFQEPYAPRTPAPADSGALAACALCSTEARADIAIAAVKPIGTPISLGAATDPYKALKTTLRAEIDEEAWASLRSAVSRPFPKPRSGRIAVKVINHLGDEAMR